MYERVALGFWRTIYRLLATIFRLWTTIFRLLATIFHLWTTIFRLWATIFCLLATIFRLLDDDILSLVGFWSKGASKVQNMTKFEDKVVDLMVLG